MSIAFEITPEDVQNVLHKNNKKADPDTLYALLDTAAVEKAALYGNDIEEQTQYAYDEIERQLKQEGRL
jgi:hypothetical protein